MRDIRQRGFSMIEMMVSLTVLIIGLVGILGLQRTAVRASAYSRHATEASVLAEDKLEELRTVPTATLATGTDQVDPQGNPGTDYTRTWTVTNNGTIHTIVLTIGWNERGGADSDAEDYHEIEFRTQRPM